MVHSYSLIFEDEASMYFFPPAEGMVGSPGRGRREALLGHLCLLNQPHTFHRA